MDTGPSGFIDQANGAFLVVQLAAGAPDLGQFNVAVPGLGLFVSIDRAKVTVNSASSVQLAYSWAAYLDSGAVLDSMSAYLTEPSGQLAPVQVGLVADLHPEALTGTVTLTYAGQQYAVAADPAPHTADPLLNQIITVITQQNWAELYALSDRRIRSAVQESQFVAAASSGFQAAGTVTSAQVLVAPNYKSDKMGFRTAAALLACTLTNGGTSSTVGSRSS